MKSEHKEMMKARRRNIKLRLVMMGQIIMVFKDRLKL